MKKISYSFFIIIISLLKNGKIKIASNWRKEKKKKKKEEREKNLHYRFRFDRYSTTKICTEDFE